jgi:hypothetical protein
MKRSSPPDGVLAMAFDLSAAIHEAGVWVVGALGIVASAWAVRRRISGDSLAVTKNQSEGNWIEDFKRERDEAVAREREQRDEAVAREREHLKRIASLEMRNALMVERMERMDRELSRIKRLLIEARPDLATLLNSDFSPLPDLPPEG